jgi:hypothetical protein
VIAANAHSLTASTCEDRCWQMLIAPMTPVRRGPLQQCYLHVMLKTAFLSRRLTHYYPVIPCPRWESGSDPPCNDQILTLKTGSPLGAGHNCEVHYTTSHEQTFRTRVKGKPSSHTHLKSGWRTCHCQARCVWCGPLHMIPHRHPSYSREHTSRRRMPDDCRELPRTAMSLHLPPRIVHIRLGLRSAHEQGEWCAVGDYLPPPPMMSGAARSPNLWGRWGEGEECNPSENAPVYGIYNMWSLASPLRRRAVGAYDGYVRAFGSSPMSVLIAYPRMLGGWR